MSDYAPDFETLKADTFAWIIDVPVAEDADTTEALLAESVTIQHRAKLVQTHIGDALLEHDRGLAQNVRSIDQRIAELMGQREAVEKQRGVIAACVEIIDADEPTAQHFHGLEVAMPKQDIDVLIDKRKEQMATANNTIDSTLETILEKETPLILWLDPGVRAEDRTDFRGWVIDRRPELKKIMHPYTESMSRVSRRLARFSLIDAGEFSEIVTDVLVEDGRNGLVIDNPIELAKLTRVNGLGPRSVIAMLAIADMQAAERVGTLTFNAK